MVLPIALLFGLALEGQVPETPPGPPSSSPPAAPAGYCAPPCAPIEEAEPGPWTGAAALSAIWLTGNTKEFTLGANGYAEYRTQDWVATFSGETVLSRASTSRDDDEEEVAEALSASARGERRFTSLLGAYALFEGGADHFSSVELRLDGEAGLAFTLVERETAHARPVLLRVDIGLHDSKEFRRQYFDHPEDLPDANLLAPGARLTFYGPINERLRFAQYAEVFPGIASDSRVVFGSKSTLSSYITERLALNATFTVDADSAPAPGVASTDTALMLGAEVDF